MCYIKINIYINKRLSFYIFIYVIKQYIGVGLMKHYDNNKKLYTTLHNRLFIGPKELNYSNIGRENFIFVKSLKSEAVNNFLQTVEPDEKATYEDTLKEHFTETNSFDLYNCAALSFHKALIGIADLALIEEIERFGKERNKPYSLYISKAIQTYYSVYHLFVCAMLLDPLYNIKVNYYFIKDYEVSYDDLNSESQDPEQWNNGRKFEQDLASAIQHRHIRKYCEEVRQRPDKDEEIELLYNNYIKHNNGTTTCIPGLFEKLDYIRDRAIYRPTHVILKEGGYAQTSAEVRKEIDFCPSSQDIYETLFDYFKIILSKSSSNPLYLNFCYMFANIVEQGNSGNYIRLSDEDISCLHYTWDELEKELDGDPKGKAVPAGVCQMMQVFDKEYVKFAYQKYWKPIIDCYYKK